MSMTICPSNGSFITLLVAEFLYVDAEGLQLVVFITDMTKYNGLKASLLATRATQIQSACSATKSDSIVTSYMQALVLC